MPNGTWILNSLFSQTFYILLEKLTLEGQKLSPVWSSGTEIYADQEGTMQKRKCGGEQNSGIITLPSLTLPVIFPKFKEH